MNRKTDYLKEPIHKAARTIRACVLCLLAALTAFTVCLNPFTDPAAAAAPSANGAVPAGDSANGEAIYEKYCHFCHGPKGRGDGPIGIAITPKPVDFTTDKRMLKTDKELFSSISNGIRRENGGKEMAMPRWKDILSEKDIRDVLAYVRQLEREGKKDSKK